MKDNNLKPSVVTGFSDAESSFCVKIYKVSACKTK